MDELDYWCGEFPELSREDVAAILETFEENHDPKGKNDSHTNNGT